MPVIIVTTKSPSDVQPGADCAYMYIVCEVVITVPAAICVKGFPPEAELYVSLAGKAGKV